MTDTPADQAGDIRQIADLLKLKVGDFLLIKLQDGSWSYAEVHQVSPEEVRGFGPFIQIGLEVNKRNGESLLILGAFTLWDGWRARPVSKKDVRGKTFACEHLRKTRTSQ